MLITQGPTLAAPSLAQTQPLAGLELTISAESVGNTVDYSPNQPDGSNAAPQTRERYRAQQLDIKWTASEYLTLQSSIAERSFTSLRDQFKLTHLAFKTLYHANTANTIELGLATNFQSTIEKNSYTTIGNNTLKHLTISNPHDLILHAGIKHTLPLLSSGTLDLYSAIGYIKSTNDNTSGNITRDNCDYTFNFNANGGMVDQEGACGDILSLKRAYPTEQSIESEYGVSPVSDTSFTGRFFRIGGEYAWVGRQWRSRIGLYHQHTDRGDLDQRIASRQQPGFRNNLSLFTETARTIRSGWAIGARIEYQRRQFLDTVPVLYTSFTSHRFESDVLFLSLHLGYTIN